MAQADNADKFRNMLFNAGLIIAALFVAYSIYNAGNSAANSLKTEISEEIKKNSALENINKLEQRLAVYRNLLSKRDASEVMGDIGDIANGAGVKVISLKPSQRESASDYSKEIFDVTVTVKDYHALAKFVNEIEAYKNVYMVENMEINGIPAGMPADSENRLLTVNLKISSVSANQ